MYSINSSCYHSVLGKHPWALKHNSQFWPTWALIQDQTSTRTGPLEMWTGTYMGTYIREWALAKDTMVNAYA